MARISLSTVESVDVKPLSDGRVQLQFFVGPVPMVTKAFQVERAAAFRDALSRAIDEAVAKGGAL